MGDVLVMKVTVQFVDDLDGTALDEGCGRTLRFSLGIDSYEIDLSDSNENALRSARGPFMPVARKASPSSRRAKPRPALAESPATVRQWGIENGLDVPTQGRIPSWSKRTAVPLALSRSCSVGFARRG